MLPHGKPFRMCSDVDAAPTDVLRLVSGSPYNGIREITPGDGFSVIGGHFSLDGNAALLTSVLPSFVHLRGGDNDLLRSAVERIATELRDAQPGSEIIAQQSATTMLVLALRRYMAEGPHEAGWLAALADAQLSRAIARMHDAPSHAWTVQTLAEEAAMSRTAFAERFRRVVGTTPMEYLTRWRMLVAADRLRDATESIATVAAAVGYESESAFSAAFKRTMGRSPRAFHQRVGVAGE